MLNQFIRFFVVGLCATAIHLLLYILLNRIVGATENTPILLTLTYATGYLISFVANYVVSLKWTFRTNGSVGKGAGFALSHLVNAGMHILLLNVFRSIGLGQNMALFIATYLPCITEFWPNLTKAESLLPLPIYCIVVPINFLMVRFFLTQGDKEIPRQ